MDEPIPIEGIIEGDPETLAVLCAAGGSAIVAYCSAVGVRENFAEIVVTALTTFRRGVVENAAQDPSQLQDLLLSATAQAAQWVAGVDPSRQQLAAGRAVLKSATIEPLAPGLAPQIIGALVAAAPVTALRGDAGAVRHAAEQQYVQRYDAQAGTTPTPAPRAPAVGPAAWIPPGLDLPAATVAPTPGWNVPDASAEAQPQGSGDTPPATPVAPRQPGGLVIKRGGHWPFGRRPRRSPPRPGGRGKIVLFTGIVGLALGGAIGVVATPEKTVRVDPVIVRPLDTPFTVDGAVFSVARTSTAAWARSIRRRAPRPGRAWLTLAAQTRNVSRPNYHPQGLGYRLRSAAGIVIGPETALGAGDTPEVGGRVPIGKRSSIHLAFQVPVGRRGLTLEYETGSRGQRVRVPLN